MGRGPRRARRRRRPQRGRPVRAHRTAAAHTATPRGALRTVAVPAGSDPARRMLPARTTEPFRLSQAKVYGRAQLGTPTGRTWAGR